MAKSARKPVPARKAKKVAKKATVRKPARTKSAHNKKKSAPRKAAPARSARGAPKGPRKAARVTAAPTKAIRKSAPARAAKKPAQRPAAPTRAVAAKPVVSKAIARKAVVAPAPAVKAAAPSRPKHPPTLDRARKTVRELHGVPSSLGEASLSSAARSGQADLRHQMRNHSSTSPALTAGDVDADWQSADSTGDEAPGGDNPTPDQDVVDEIGRALGVEYADDEELKGGDEIAERDRHRWELDPASKDDFEDQE